MFEGLPIQIFHGDEGLAFRFADVVDGADMGVIQRTRGTRFPAESFDRVGVAGELARQELQGDEATEPGIPATVDDAHAASPQLLDNSVMRNGLAWTYRIAAVA